MVRNIFVEALWLEVPSHLLTETWTSVPAIPHSACKDDYIQWFLPRSHRSIQNPMNVPRGFHLPVDPPMPTLAPIDLIAHEVHRDDAGEEERLDRIADLVKRHYRSS
ncbi:hypothetical protein M9H77_31156 [Catharanthus roseus]|uniref:Uncharacterized protein n=1 Tax=Catharanthus roseus TaxID=4058 RepID=A0ACC0A1C5_CATRO|nr:hypothetical protein M9H77_31156 [Catharanthus roseus]